jgi:hypothetical protein
MKKVILLMVFVFTVSLSFASNIKMENSTTINVDNFELIKNSKLMNKNISVIVEVDISNNSYRPCTIKGSVTVTTEDGDELTIDFKVTAKSCKEAIRVQNKIISAFDEE